SHYYLSVCEHHYHVLDNVRHLEALSLLLEFFLALCGGLFSRCCAFRRCCHAFWFFCHDITPFRSKPKSKNIAKLERSMLRPYKLPQPFLPTVFFLAATAPRRGPLRVRALVCVRWPRTGKLR